MLIYLCQNKYMYILLYVYWNNNHVIQVAGTWLKSTGTSSNSLNSNVPAEGSTEEDNGIHWTGLTTEPKPLCWQRAWDSIMGKKMKDVRWCQNRAHFFIMSGEHHTCTHIKSFHNLEMASKMYSCKSVRVRECLGKAKAADLASQWWFLLLDWKGWRHFSWN